jgi:hypothetical protein
MGFEIALTGLFLWLIDFIFWISRGMKRQNPALIILGIILVIIGAVLL